MKRIILKTLKGHTQLHPKRVKSLTGVLQSHLSSSSSSSVSTASSTMQFTPDSTKLVLAIESLVVLLDLTVDSNEKSAVQVIRSFPQHRSTSTRGETRVIKPLPSSTRQGRGQDNDVKMNGNGSDDDDESEEAESDLEDGEPLRRSEDRESWPLISQMSISADCQWLATSDLAGRTHVFNVDAVKVSLSCVSAEEYNSDLRVLNTIASLHTTNIPLATHINIVRLGTCLQHTYPHSLVP